MTNHAYVRTCDNGAFPPHGLHPCGFHAPSYTVIPAVDSPDPGGLDWPDLQALLRPLLAHPAALGLQITVFDPDLDPDGQGAATLADFLVAVLRRV